MKRITLLNNYNLLKSGKKMKDFKTKKAFNEALYDWAFGDRFDDEWKDIMFHRVEELDKKIEAIMAYFRK